MTKEVFARRITLTVCALLGFSLPSLAGKEIWFATQVPTVDGWNNEDKAQGSPDCGTNCASIACAANSPVGYTAWLVANRTGATDQPSSWWTCKRITDVYVNCRGAWGSGSGTVKLRVTGTGFPDQYRDFAAHQTCGWIIDRHSGPGCTDDGWRLDPPAGGWTANVVRNLKPQIRRASPSTPNWPFWLDAFRIIVYWEYDPSGPPSNCWATPATINPGGSAQLAGAVAAGLTIDWYAGGCNGAYIGTGNPLTVYPTATTSYYGKARNPSTGCVSATCCGPVVVQVVPLPPPDLTVDNLTVTPANPTAGGTATVTARISNIGAGPSPTASVVLIRHSSGQPSGACSQNDGVRVIPALPPNGSTTVEFPTVYPTAGTFRTWVCVDPCNAITESNETNNCTSRDVSVGSGPPLPDWSIQSITIVPSSPAVNQAIQVQVVVRNEGGAAPATQLGIWKNSPGCPPGGCQPDVSLPVPALAAGAATTVVGPIGFYPAAGSYQLCACVDPCNAVQESNDSNNCRAIPITVGPQPPCANLVVENVIATPSAPNTNQQFTLAFTVRNAGTCASAATSAGVIWHSPSQPANPCAESNDSRDIPALAPGASVTRQIQYAYSTSGPKTAWVVADVCNVVAESNEADNYRSLLIPVGSGPPPPDLQITSLTYAPQNPSVNQTITVTAVVRNSGGPAGPFWVTLVTHSPGQPATRCPGDVPPQRISGLGTNLTAVVRFQVSYATYGNKRLWVCADGCDEVFESNETNNCRSQDLYVRSALLLGEEQDDEPNDELDGEQADSLEIDPEMTDGGEFPAPLLGDLNCDGRVDLGDIDPFALALSDENQYWEEFSHCDAMRADCNGDGVLSLEDIDWFVTLITEQ